MTVRLHGVFCPHCQDRATTMALESGPQLVHHRANYVRSGARVRCNTVFVAIPAGSTVETRVVTGRLEADTALRSATTQWLLALESA